MGDKGKLESLLMRPIKRKRDANKFSNMQTEDYMSQSFVDKDTSTEESTAKKRAHPQVQPKMTALEILQEGLNTAISSSNKGFQLLQKMGFKEGQGLGKAQQGRTQPVELFLNTKRRGIGANTTTTLGTGEGNVVDIDEFRKRKQTEFAEKCDSEDSDGDWGRFRGREERTLARKVAAEWTIPEIVLFSQSPHYDPHLAKTVGQCVMDWQTRFLLGEEAQSSCQTIVSQIRSRLEALDPNVKVTTVGSLVTATALCEDFVCDIVVQGIAGESATVRGLVKACLCSNGTFDVEDGVLPNVISARHHHTKQRFCILLGVPEDPLDHIIDAFKWETTLGNVHAAVVFGLKLLLTLSQFATHRTPLPAFVLTIFTACASSMQRKSESQTQSIQEQIGQLYLDTLDVICSFDPVTTGVRLPLQIQSHQTSATTHRETRNQDTTNENPEPGCFFSKTERGLVDMKRPGALVVIDPFRPAKQLTGFNSFPFEDFQTHVRTVREEAGV